MIVKMISKKPSHQVAEQAVEELLKRSADFSLQMVKFSTAANVCFVCLYYIHFYTVETKLLASRFGLTTIAMATVAME